MNLRDGLTKWFLEGSGEDVVRRNVYRRFFSNTNRLDEHHGLNHCPQHGKIEREPSQNFLGPIFLSKKVHMMFLHVLEVFLGCFSRSVYRERRRRECGSKSRSRV